MLALLIIISTVGPVICFTAMISIGVFELPDSLIHSIAPLFFIGYLTHITLTVLAYSGVNSRHIAANEKEFWKTVLIRCFYQLAGLPIYYVAVVKRHSRKDNGSMNESSEQLKNRILFYLLKVEIFGILALLISSALLAVLSFIFIGLIDYPSFLFNLAVVLMLLFPGIFYCFYLRMLEIFVSKSKDQACLIYYFGMKRWIFGVLEFYRLYAKMPINKQLSLYPGPESGPCQ